MELRREREFYWDYLVNHWLVPGTAVFSHSEEATSERRTAPTAQTLQENGWFLEPEHACEQ
jgi:hypothetical protein